MKTFSINLFDYSELSEEAKKKARNTYKANNDYYNLENDMIDFINQLLPEYEIEGDATPYWSLSYCQGDGAMFEGSFYWKGYSVNVKHSGRYYHSNCKEIDIVDSSKDDSPDAPKEVYQEFEELYQEICKKLEKHGYSCIEYEDSEEFIADQFDCNEYKFLESGKVFSINTHPVL